MAQKRIKITVNPGINRSPGATSLSSTAWIDGDKFRFVDALPQKLGGWDALTLDGTISGCPRTLFSFESNNQKWTIVGAHSYLYSRNGGERVNITPLVTSTTALGVDPFATTNTSTTVVVPDTAHNFTDGDRVLFAGSAATNGIPAAELNAEHIIDNTTTNTYEITVTTPATSTGTGGGASVTRQGQIAAGECDSINPVGYGIGQFGVGQFGVSQTDSSQNTIPRTWSVARFFDDVVMTPGGEGKIYEWLRDTDTAPAVLSNAPTDVNWVLSSDNIVIALGPGNRIRGSDTGNNNLWAPAPTNDAIDRNIAEADEFMSGINTRGTNLLFTKNGQVWRMDNIGGNDVWSVQPVSGGRGPISPRAMAEVNGFVAWVGSDNLYMFNGSNIEVVPNELAPYIFEGDDRINWDQRFKVTAWANESFGEIWYHYPTSIENDKYAILHLREKYQGLDGESKFGFAIGDMDRTAGESGTQLTEFPLTANSTGTLYQHESGVDDDGSAMDSFIETNYGMLGEGDTTMDFLGLVPDSTQTGNVDVTVTTKLYPQTAIEDASGPYVITPTTEIVNFRNGGRQRKVRFSQDVIGEDWRMGRWFEIVARSGGR